MKDPDTSQPVPVSAKSYPDLRVKCSLVDLCINTIINYKKISQVKRFFCLRFTTPS